MSRKNSKTTKEDRQTAASNGVTYSGLIERLARGWPKELAINRPPHGRFGNEEYALYKGERFIEIGTLQELADLRGVKFSTMQFYLTPTYQKRIAERKKSINHITLTKLEDDEE